MKDFPLEEMSPTSFEQLALALCVHVMGADVQAFGIGRDGGREATYHGEIVWPTGEQSGEPEKWDGYTVVQAKMKLIKSNDPGENLKWLKSEISKEIDAWTDANTKRGTIPDNILFVTNVRLSSAPSAGGIDQINKFIGDKMKKVHYRRRISKWRVWHRDQLVTYLNAYQGIRQAFPALLTAGDVLSRLGQVGIRSSSETRAKP